MTSYHKSPVLATAVLWPCILFIRLSSPPPPKYHCCSSLSTDSEFLTLASGAQTLKIITW